MNRTPATKNLESVLRFTRGVSYGDDRLWTIFKFEQGRSRVLDLAIEKEIADKRFHLFDLAEQIDQYLDSMTTKVEHRTAAGQISFQQRSDVRLWTAAGKRFVRRRSDEDGTPEDRTIQTR